MLLEMIVVMGLAVTPMVECERVKLFDPVAKTTISLCTKMWFEHGSKNYDRECFFTNHGHGHVFYMHKDDPTKILVPSVGGKAIICQQV